MSKVLYIQASPRGDRSWSSSVADAFIDAYRKKNPSDEIETLNLFEADLPAFDGLAVQAKYAILHGKKHTQDECDAWRAVERVIEKFKSADKYVVSSPMWNFGVPYALKQYLDLLVQPTYTFSFSPEEGYKGMVTGKPLLIVSARGGEYRMGTEGAPMNFQQPYLELIFGFMGFKEIQTIEVEPTLAGGPELAKQRKEEAVARAKEIAQSF